MLPRWFGGWIMPRGCCSPVSGGAKYFRPGLNAYSEKRRTFRIKLKFKCPCAAHAILEPKVPKPYTLNRKKRQGESSTDTHRWTSQISTDDEKMRKGEIPIAASRAKVKNRSSLRRSEAWATAAICWCPRSKVQRRKSKVKCLMSHVWSLSNLKWCNLEA